MLTADQLYHSPNALAEHYRQFRVAERLLLTGHSHQAWPDVALHGMEKCWQDAATHVDDKWERAFAVAGQVKAAFATLLHDCSGYYALGQNSHELVVRFLSALALRQRPRLITTDSEFHSIRRQLDRLAEEGIEIVRVPSQPLATLVARLNEQVNSKTAAVLISSVFYDSGLICPPLTELMQRCEQNGVELLIDLYHQLNVVPFDVEAQGLQQAFLVGGGYKYCQLGEGNCFLRFPTLSRLRPVITGWYAEFDLLVKRRESGVAYGEGSSRFAGATYDPISHYRAVEVFDFFRRHQLSVELLREVSQYQLQLLLKRIEMMSLPEALIGCDQAIPLSQRAGFLVVTSEDAAEIAHRLHERGVWCDVRGRNLRFGPAPYLSDQQLHQAMDIFHAVLHDLRRERRL